MENRFFEKWRINRDDPTPLGQQLTNNIKCSISTGEIGNGFQLPPVREMATRLGVGIETVRTAYKTLEAMQLVSTRPHHGTRVLLLDQSALRSTADDSMLRTVINTLNQGYSPEEVRSMFEQALLEATEHFNQVKILLIECTDYEMMCFGNQLSKDLNVQVDTLSIYDLDSYMPSFAQSGKQYHAIVTTYFHYGVVSKAFQPYNIPTYGIIIEMNSNTINFLLSLDSGAHIGIICERLHSMQYYINLIQNIRGDLEVHPVYSDDLDGLEELMLWADAFFVTHPCEKYVTEHAPEKPVYFFYDQINSQSIGLLREYLLSQNNGD